MSTEPELWEPMTREELARRSALDLANRRARGEIMTYRQDGWMVREYPGQRIERLCPEDEFVAANYPIPAMNTEETSRRRA